ncbi:serine hydrolase [Paraglaciecola chathamensis]|uniref:Serine hydrolase n=1 Tax=Paraglaciecola chathamensis TaxID=368405 RepID=A0ABS0WGM3_9ALTE|nr:serine hydrolase [Paraglaciecola chathamensis]MBJ2137621.1 serine hydrolase [Paraglaciecola chathamensis]
MTTRLSKNLFKTMRLLTVGGLAVLMVACAVPQKDEAVPASDSKYVADISWPQEEWEYSSLAAEGFDPEPVNQFIEDLVAEEYGRVDHFLLIRHGRIVVEKKIERDYAALAANLEPDELLTPNFSNPIYNYDDANLHPYYQGTDLHTVQSVTKSINAAAFGIAIDEGFIEGTDAPALPFFNDYLFDKSDPRKERITVGDLLTMRSGIEWNDKNGFGSETDSTYALENSKNWIQFILDQPMYAEPGTVFKYNDGVSVLLGKILHEATGQRVDAWAQKKLFSPIGIDKFHWKITPDDEADTEGGLYLTAHDMARIGYLYLRNGLWNGKQIISEEWIRRSVTPYNADASSKASDNSTEYGFQWWIPEQTNGSTLVFGGYGLGGQRILVFPEYDVIAVFLGWDPVAEYWKASNAFQTTVLPLSLKKPE